MSNDRKFEIQKCSFNSDVVESFHDIHYAKAFWPVIYLLSHTGRKEMYVGETADLYARMAAHLKNDAKKKLKDLHVITSNKFNKSATLDIESNLIKYISADEKFKLLNANIGLANHNYFQKNEIYWNIFQSIWDALKVEGITKHSLKEIDNSDLFKYSPYKSLTWDQRMSLLRMMKSLLDTNNKTTVVEGGAGTGKSVLAVFLFKLLNTDFRDVNLKEFGDDELEFIDTVYRLKKMYQNPRMALVVPMAPFRITLQKVFSNVQGLSSKMVVGPTQIADDEFDIIVVDEAHRLRRRRNLGGYFRDFDKISNKLGFDKYTQTELDWVKKQGKKLVLFYDEGQSVRPSDVRNIDFIALKSSKSTCVQQLKSQLRIKGGPDYIEYINKLMNCTFTSEDKVFRTRKYSFLLFDSLEDMRAEIMERNREKGLARLIAGFSWPWISQTNKKELDIKIGNVALQWNSVTRDWINSNNAINEVGCIHTSQGYDLNYAGVIFGREISYDEEKNEIVILKKNYFDANGKAGITDPDELKTYIINIYTTILKRGIEGTYVYACDEKLRKYLARHISMAKPRSESGVVVSHTKSDKIIPFVNAIPLYDLKAAAGNFSAPHHVSDLEWILLPTGIRPDKSMFACKVTGESMNKVIPNGAICLFKFYESGSRDGKIVLAQHTSIQEKDFGSGLTVKEYRSQKYIGEERWNHESITLYPKSYDDSYQPIQIIKEDELNPLTVIAIFDRVLYEDEV
jgi:uncharacterized protein